MKDWNKTPLRRAWGYLNPSEEQGSTWEDAERLFPGCSAQWDAQGGEAWVAGRERLTIAIITSPTKRATLAIGCGTEEPFGWALWMARDGVNQWLFL